MTELPIILADGTQDDVDAVVAANSAPANQAMFPADSRRLYVGKADGTVHVVGWPCVETTVAVSAAGNSDLICSAGFPIHLGRVTAAAGAGAYTRKLVLPAVEDGGVDVLDGTIWEARVEFAASLNPTIEVRNETAGGTLLWSRTPAAAVAENWSVRFARIAGAWVSMGATQIF